MAPPREPGHAGARAGVPFLIFGPRRARLLAAFVFSFFQIFNAATANYGFFCYLAAALNVFLLDDADVSVPARGGALRCRPAIRGVVTRLPLSRAPASPQLGRRESGSTPTTPVRWIGRAGAALFVLVSLTDALYAFTEPGRAAGVRRAPFELNRRFRLVNSYHLFASITRERIEPELQTLPGEPPVDGRRRP